MKAHSEICLWLKKLEKEQRFDNFEFSPDNNNFRDSSD